MISVWLTWYLLFLLLFKIIDDEEDDDDDDDEEEEEEEEEEEDDDIDAVECSLVLECDSWFDTDDGGEWELDRFL